MCGIVKLSIKCKKEEQADSKLESIISFAVK